MAGTAKRGTDMWGFIIAVIAGFATPYVETPLAVPLARLTEKFVRVDQAELRMVAFAIVMLIAGVAAELLHSGSAFWVILGGVIGVFAARIVASLKEIVENRPKT
jgi:hypothetical protein